MKATRTMAEHRVPSPGEAHYGSPSASASSRPLLDVAQGEQPQQVCRAACLRRRELAQSGFVLQLQSDLYSCPLLTGPALAVSVYRI